MLPYLEPHFTVHAVDRRGRGGRGGRPDYALEREFEDVVAVVDTVAGECGALVDPGRVAAQVMPFLVGTD